MTPTKKAAAAKKAAPSTAASAKDAEGTSTSTETTTTDTDTNAVSGDTETPADPASVQTQATEATEPTKTDQAVTTDTGTTQPGLSGRDSAGPGTSLSAPFDRSSRPPATIVNQDPAAAPLAPPADSHTQREPRHGYAESSTNQVYAEAGGRTIAGENHLRIIGEDGNDLTEDALFADDNAVVTTVQVKVRAYEEFTYPNTKRSFRRLLFVPGQNVPRAKAARIVRAIKAAAEQNASGEPSNAEPAGVGDDGTSEE